MDHRFRELLDEWQGRPGNIIPLLQKTQDLDGYLSQEAMQEIARVTERSPAEIYGVATFYAQFRFTPRGKHSLKVCHGTACHVNGAEALTAALERELGVSMGETTPDGAFTVEKVACLGCCSLAPVVMLDNEVEGRLDSNKVCKTVNRIRDNGNES